MKAESPWKGSLELFSSFFCCWIRPGLRNMLGVDVGDARALIVSVLSYADTPVLYIM